MLQVNLAMLALGKPKLDSNFFFPHLVFSPNCTDFSINCFTFSI